jgi:hypothetical protein
VADTNHDSRVSVQELERYVLEMVEKRSEGRQSPEASGRQQNDILSWTEVGREICDGIDNDRDGLVDEGFPDTNGNGIPDCVDQEVCNGLDDNGNGKVDEPFDKDGDGYPSIALCGSRFGTDCDDHDAAIHPDQKDIGNLIDDDCDGLKDEDDVDWNCNGIPDSMEKLELRLRKRRDATLAGGILAALGSAAAYAYLYWLPSDSPGRVTDADESHYRVASAVTYGLGGVGLASFGLSFSFGRGLVQLRASNPPLSHPYPPGPGCAQRLKASR